MNNVLVRGPHGELRLLQKGTNGKFIKRNKSPLLQEIEDIRKVVNAQVKESHLSKILPAENWGMFWAAVIVLRDIIVSLEYNSEAKA